MRYGIAAAALVAVMTGGQGIGASAQTVEEFYKGKTIEIISSAGVGTQYDGWARVLARHLPRFIPGGPAVVVKNMPGGGHITATNHLYNVAAQDGTVLGMISRTIPTSAALKNPAIKFDVTRFHWLASTDNPFYICAANGDAKVQKAEDLFATELTAGGAGQGSGASIVPTMLNTVLGMKFRLVEGYKSPTEVMLAMERKEVESICITLSSIQQHRPGWLESGRLRPILTLDRNTLTHVPGLTVPSVYPLTRTEEQRQIIAFFNANSELGRPLLAPPGVPADRVAALRRAFDAALKDPAVIEDAKKANYDHAPLSGEELKRRIDALLATPQDVIDKAKPYLESGGG
jgi:tripartite-type tricarboxylate transporter receptor subunit TctC